MRTPLMGVMLAGTLLLGASSAACAQQLAPPDLGPLPHIPRVIPVHQPVASAAPDGQAAPAQANTGQARDAAPSAHPKGAQGEVQSSPKETAKDKRTQLEGLLAALKAAPDERSARTIANRLDQLFNTTDSAALDLLMARASLAMEAKDYDLAVRLLDQLLAVDPDDIGARAKRATIFYLRDDYGPALADIREILAREPRHFNAMLGLALMLRDMGEDKLALDAARRALEVNPHLDVAQEMVTQLSVTVEGRDI